MSASGAARETLPSPGPVIICVRGPSKSGKTAMVERLIDRLAAVGVRAGYVKRTHHPLDLPNKASGRVWSRGPAVMALAAPDRMQITTPPTNYDASSLLALLPGDLDLALLETHTPEAYPTIISRSADEVAGEDVLGSWSLESIERDVPPVLAKVLELLPQNRELWRALRTAAAFHGGHGCAGIILGTRLALCGAASLGVALPDTEKRLLISVETDRCAVDAIQAVSGCRPGKRTLRLLDYGKLAATFFDTATDSAVRVAARGDLRARVSPIGASRDECFEAQRVGYLSLPVEELFVVTPTTARWSEYDLPGRPRQRVTCGSCGEEVSDGRHVSIGGRVLCRPCSATVSDS